MAEAPRARAVRKMALSKKMPALDEGDYIEFSLTAEVRPRHSPSLWVKGGGGTTVRPGETPEEARQRLVEFVMSGVNEQVAEAMS